MHLIATLFIIFCSITQIFAQRFTSERCPDGYKYIYVNSDVGWVALGWAWTGENHKLHNITLDVNFATGKLQDTSYLGELKIVNFYFIRQSGDVKQWNIIYEIKFPIQEPLPIITSVVLNGDSLCDDSENEFTQQRPELVKFKLRYNNYLKEQRVTSELVSKPESHTEASVSHGPGYAGHESSDGGPIECGKVDLTNIYVPLILEGTTIQRGTWPWLVSVYSYSNLRLGFRCGATLISDKLVVTAAHCFFDIYNRQVRLDDVLVILGQYNLKRPQDQGTQIVYPESVNVHPEYRKRNKIDSDIAVVVMMEKIRFTTYIRPACLWKEPDTKDSIVGLKGFTAGWGRDEYGNFFTELPKQAEIPVVSDETCLRSHEAFTRITSEVTFCAGWRNGTEGPCNGDSGGPLVFERDGHWTLRGVVSTSLSKEGSNTCNLNEYVVFTDVAKFRNWIMDFNDDYDL